MPALLTRGRVVSLPLALFGRSPARSIAAPVLTTLAVMTLVRAAAALSAPALMALMTLAARMGIRLI